MSVHPDPVVRLKELTPSECWALVSSVPVGRLAWQGPQAPIVIPVNFTVDGHSIRIRTTAYSAAGQQCDDSIVAFQIDSVDPETRTGWSVLMQGEAHVEYSPPTGPQPQPWLSGPRTMHMRIDVDEISGRELRPSDV